MTLDKLRFFQWAAVLVSVTFTFILHICWFIPGWLIPLILVVSCVPPLLDALISLSRWVSPTFSNWPTYFAKQYVPTSFTTSILPFVEALQLSVQILLKGCWSNLWELKIFWTSPLPTPTLLSYSSFLFHWTWLCPNFLPSFSRAQQLHLHYNSSSFQGMEVLPVP